MTQEQLQKLDAMAKPRSEEAIRKAEERKKQREDKDLLLRDLCGRLPYGVKCQVTQWDTNEIMTLTQINRNDAYFFFGVNGCFSPYYGAEIKPYLRPMSSMTEEEKKEFIEYAGYEIEESVNGRHYEYYLKDFCGTPDNPSVNTGGVDWLNKKMFDYRGLIEKGLAIEVTEDNNPYKD